MVGHIMLSVIVISHNQKGVLRRCIDSILVQRTSFPVEVIVSDDRSNDGTREMLLSDYKGKVITTFFNSDECETSYVLERAALNRINGLKKATGKYLIHIDGDDFFTGTDLFQVMVDKLEAHPECTLCCQNYCILPYNNLDAPKIPKIQNSLFREERILTGAAFVAKVGIGHNSSFCMRRSADVKIEDLTSDSYDDIDITMQYIRDGKVALVNKCDFVYVQYGDSTCATIPIEERKIIFQSEIMAIQRVPYLAGVLMERHLKGFAVVSFLALTRKEFPERLIKYCNKMDMFLFRTISNNISFKDKSRYFFVMLLSVIMKLSPIRSLYLRKLLYKLSVNTIIKKEVVL